VPLFRRKSPDVDLVEDAIAAAAAQDDAEAPTDADGSAAPTKAYTAPKGRETPKRTVSGRRVVEPPPANRREAYRRQREKQRADRAEAAAGMRRGEERYLLPRDRGEERALVRDIVDARRTVGTWFFGGALIVILGSSAAMPPAVRLASNMLWLALAFGVVADSVLIARKIKKVVLSRFPKTTQRMGSLYLYGIMRGITFRKMRIPKPRVKLGEKV
jgi:hypothetical protein